MATRKVKPETENLSSAIDSILRERKMNRNALINAIEAALISAYKKNYGRNSDVRVTFDGRDVEITAQKSVVEEVQDPHTEITLEEAREIDPRYGLGDRIPVVVNPRDFGRIAAQTAKQVIVQHMREAERGVIYDEYIEKENEVLTAIVQSVESNDNVFVEIGRTEGILEASQRMPGEEISPQRPPKGVCAQRVAQPARPADHGFAHASGAGQAIVRAGSAGDPLRRGADSRHRARSRLPHQDGRAFQRFHDRRGGFLRGPARHARGKRGK